ncbi:MAG TPA: hypothetical protein VFA10_26260 [Ktedonobacteraceae bacterium]|nr:hypothetical protein [Ktedonobacteraceae bacterium]
MRKMCMRTVTSFLLVLTLLVTMTGLSFAWTKGSTSVHLSTSATPAIAHLHSKHVVNMMKVPKEKAQLAGPRSGKPSDLGSVDAGRAYAQYKATTVRNSSISTIPSTSTSIQTSSLTTSFQGMADSSAICPPAGCQVPDDALAASPNWVLQGVNTSFAVYDTSGNLQTGWPKTSQAFFGIPDLPGNCDPNGVYTIDVRAFYDSNDGRFWVAMYQAEDAFGIGTGCPFVSLYWIAVSQSNNPNGNWNVYSFDMTNGTSNAADFTQFGFDAQAIYFSGNMYNNRTTAYQYPEIFAASKSLMEHGSTVTPYGFFNLQFNGQTVDTVQPVETLSSTPIVPATGLFINSFNYYPGNYECSAGCHGLVVWAMANPTSVSPSLSSMFVDTTWYRLAPPADEPGCIRCIDTNQTEISAIPIYQNGLISFALDTGVNNGTQDVPGVFWGQVKPVLNSQGTLIAASIYQSGYLAYSGDMAAAYGALMPDATGDLFMVFDQMGASVNPQVSYVVRAAPSPLGTFQDGGGTLRAGDAPTKERLWGDFDATSYDGFTTNNVWMAGEYSPANGSWATYIANGHFAPSAPTSTPTS